mgnify:CR=1 FL=1
MSAIAVHNIPEGLAIAVPVLASTGNRWKAIWMTLASGMSEPLGTNDLLPFITLLPKPCQFTIAASRFPGAAVGLLVLRPIMTEEILENMLCSVAGSNIDLAGIRVHSCQVQSVLKSNLGCFMCCRRGYGRSLTGRAFTRSTQLQETWLCIDWLCSRHRQYILDVRAGLDHLRPGCLKPGK